MKILITGARGLLGSNLSLMYSEDHDIIATGVNKPTFSFCRNYKLDLTKKNDLKIIRDEQPDLVINCAARINADYCEFREEEAKEINAIGAKNLAEICREIGSYFVHISTDAVFDGERGNYSERDKPNPIHVYGKTKLMAEELINRVGGNYTIIRTTLYGWNHLNKLSLSEWVLDSLEKKEEIKGFTDLLFTPILTTNLGRAILELYKKKYIGIIHVTGPEKCSKFDFERKIALLFKKDENLIKPFNSENFGFKTKRPKDLSLNIKQAENILEAKLLNIEEGIMEFKSLRENGFVDKLKK
ncbi:MAG: SDR family oxidoreductase [Nanoarchaeota archaeon]